MSVDRVLKKIVEHNNNVLGCITLWDGQIYHNLPPRFELVQCLDVAEHADNIFTLAENLETGRRPFDQTFLEFAEYSFFARKLEKGVLVLVTDPIERGDFKRIQVGINLFLKPLRRALSDTDEAVTPEVEPSVPEPEPQPKPTGQRMYRGVRY